MKTKQLFAAVMATLAVTPVSADDLYKEDKIDTDERIIKPQTISALTKDGLSIPVLSYGWRPNQPTKTVGEGALIIELVDQGSTKNFYGVFANDDWRNEVPLQVSVSETDKSLERYDTLVGLGVEHANVYLFSPTTVNVKTHSASAIYAGAVHARAGSLINVNNELNVDVTISNSVGEDSGEKKEETSLTKDIEKIHIPFGVYAEEKSKIEIKDLNLKFETKHELGTKPQGLVATDLSTVSVKDSANIQVINTATDHANAFFAFGGTVELGTVDKPIVGNVLGDVVVENEGELLPGRGSLYLTGTDSQWFGMPNMLRPTANDSLEVGLTNGASWTPILLSADSAKPQLTRMYWAGNPIIDLSKARRLRPEKAVLDLSQAKFVFLKDELTLKINSDLKNQHADQLILPVTFDGHDKVIHLMVMHDPSVVQIGDSVTAQQPVEVVTNKGGVQVKPKSVITQIHDAPLEKGRLISEVDSHGDLIRVSLVSLSKPVDQTTQGHVAEDKFEDQGTRSTPSSSRTDEPKEPAAAESPRIDHSEVLQPTEDTTNDHVTPSIANKDPKVEQRQVHLSDSALGAGDGLSAWRSLVRMSRSGWNIDEGTRLHGLWVDVNGAKVKNHGEKETFTGAKLGVDYSLTGDISMGGFVSMTHTTGDLNFGSQKGDMAAFGVRLGWYPTNAFVEGELGLGRASTDLNLHNAQGERIQGKVKGYSGWLSVVGGVTTWHNDLYSITPKVGLSHTWLESPTWIDTQGVKFVSDTLDETEAWMGLSLKGQLSKCLALNTDLRVIKSWANRGVLTGTFQKNTETIPMHTMSGTRGLLKIGLQYEPRSDVTIGIQIGAETGQAWHREVLGGLSVNYQW